MKVFLKYIYIAQALIFFAAAAAAVSYTRMYICISWIIARARVRTVKIIANDLARHILQAVCAYTTNPSSLSAKTMCLYILAFKFILIKYFVKK